MRTLIIALLASVVVGCERTAEKANKVSNGNFQVEVLFVDEDGYKVSRFDDGNQTHYYVTGGNVAVTSTEQLQGKHHIMDEVPTVRGN